MELDYANWKYFESPEKLESFEEALNYEIITKFTEFTNYVKSLYDSWICLDWVERIFEMLV